MIKWNGTPLNELTDTHLRNAIKWVEVKAIEGISQLYGGTGSEADDCWADVDALEGYEVLQHYNYLELIQEARRRQITL